MAIPKNYERDEDDDEDNKGKGGEIFVEEAG